MAQEILYQEFKGLAVANSAYFIEAVIFRCLGLIEDFNAPVGVLRYAGILHFTPV